MMQVNRETAAANAAQWISRTIAIVIVMVGPGAIGNWLDRTFQQSWFTPLGFVFGTGLATLLLIVIAKNLTPPARGKSIPFEDEPEADEPVERENHC